MSKDTATCAASDAAVIEASPPQPSPAVRRGDRQRDGSQPLSEKRALLHAQRLRTDKLRYVARPVAGGPGSLLLRSTDGALAFVLRPTASGLLIERTQRRPLGSCLVQSLLFNDHGEFVRWCELDAVRFDEPVLYDRLRREGHVHLGGVG